MTKKTTRKPTVKQLDTVLSTALDGARADAQIRMAIKAAGDTPETKFMFFVGDMANYLMTAKQWEGGDNVVTAALQDRIAQAKRALDTAKRCSHGKTVKGKKPRTAAEEKARSRASTKYSAMLKQLGMRSTGKGAGNKNAKRGTKKTKVETKVVEPKAPTTPRCATVGELQDHIAVAVAKLVALIELPNNKANKRHRVFSEALQAAHAAMLEDK